MYKQLIAQYNIKMHRTIKMAPIKVTASNEQELLYTDYNHLKVIKNPKLHVGDNVRISKYKHYFEKGCTLTGLLKYFK